MRKRRCIYLNADADADSDANADAEMQIPKFPKGHFLTNDGRGKKEIFSTLSRYVTSAPVSSQNQ